MKQADVDKLLQELQAEWPIMDLVSFNEFNIQDKLADQPYQLMRYQEKFIKEKARMEELLELRARLIGKKYDLLRFHNDKALTNKEIEQYYIPNDPDVIKVNNAISKQNVIVEYFEVCTKAIDKMQWAIKLWIEDRRYNG